MNEQAYERIKQLAECNERILNFFQTGPVQRAAIEQYSELLITEAIAVVQKRYMGDNNREDMEVRRCVEDLKKHFGIKE